MIVCRSSLCGGAIGEGWESALLGRALKFESVVDVHRFTWYAFAYSYLRMLGILATCNLGRMLGRCLLEDRGRCPQGSARKDAREDKVWLRSGGCSAN